MDNKFYKVDLHVHTPASKCYNGDKSVDGYWQILKSAVESNVRVIAITDHNTLAGYEKLIELKQKTLQEFEIIQKYDIPEKQKQELQEKVDLFNKVFIIMGVEITLNPGVHIIVLSNEGAKDDIDSLLNDIGYPPDKRGCDDVVAEMDIKHFLSDERLSEKIVLAPHVDSAKGIWNVLEGNYRADIFKSNIITAITCNGVSQLETIKNLTRNDSKYKRNKPFVYVNASDAHEQSSIGKKYSYFKLSNFSFADLKKAFDSPEDSISDTERQDFIDYVKRCTEYKPTIYLNDINELVSACYAILNNGYGCILLGIKEKYQQHGVNLTCKEIEQAVNVAFTDIQLNNNMRYVKYRCSTEQLGNGKSVGVIVTESEESRLWISNENTLYIYDDSTGFKLATIKEIEEIIRNRIISELQDFEERNNDNIWDAMIKMRHILNPISKYALYDKIKAVSVPITYYFDIEPITHIDKPNSDYSIPENGLTNGNVYYTSPSSPRLDKAYLRYSCPVYKNDDEEYLTQLFEIHSPVIVVTLGGGCHIINSREKSYFECKSPSILLIPNENFKKDNISIYHVIAWLKTNYFIWTCIQKNSDMNLFSPKVLFNSFIPNIQEYYNDCRVKDMINEILSLEQKFLTEIPKEIPEDNDEIIEVANRICDEHNNLISKKSVELELIIKKYFGINEDEDDMINNDLVDEDIFRYELNDESIETFNETEVTCI